MPDDLRDLTDDLSLEHLHLLLLWLVQRQLVANRANIAAWRRLNDLPVADIATCIWCGSKNDRAPKSDYCSEECAAWAEGC